MFVIKVKKQEVQKFIEKYKNFIDFDYKFKRDMENVIIPLKEKIPGFDVLEINGFEKKKDLKPRIGKSFDIIGEVAIFNFLDVSEEDIKKIKEIYPFIKSICVKNKKIENKYRVPKLKIVYGSDCETTYRENGIVLKLDVSKVYFSPRLSYERKRIFDQIENDEKIFVPFAGIGPYTILFTKYKNVEVYAVELNPIAYEYLVENVKLNKVENKVFCYHGDAKEIVKKFEDQYFDRIVMPLPRYSHEFLNDFLPKLKKNGIIHYYRIAESKEDIINELDQIIGKEKYKILNIRKTGSVTPTEDRYCFDIMILNIF